VRDRAEATQRGAGAYEGARPETLQRLQAPNIALRDPTAAARGIEQRAHGGLRVLSPITYANLDTSERYLWLVRGNGDGGLEIVVARRAGDRIGHPTLAYVGAPGEGAFRRVLIGGEMRYSRGLIGSSGWILDNESGRFGRLTNADETRRALQFALDLFRHQTGAVAYGDMLSASAFQRNLQLSRREWGFNWLSTGYMVSSNLSWPETVRRWVSVGLPTAIELYLGYRGYRMLL
jgi:hypothetical protein